MDKSLALVASAAVLISACSGSGPATQETQSKPATAAATPAPGASSTTPAAAQPRRANTPIPPGMVLGDSCPDGGAATTEIAAQAAATIPLKEGLTLSAVWVGTGKEASEHECLTQVTYVGTDSVNVSNSCTWAGRTDLSIKKYARMVCRRDLREASMYHTAYHDYFPVVIGGTTTFSLSARSFGEIKSAGETSHRYVQLVSRTPDPALVRDREGVVKRESSNPFTVIVNEREVALPAIQLSGRTGDVDTRITVLDDARFPLVLDYGNPDTPFSNRISKISFPTSNAIEGRLATEKRATVYGIYFSTGSDVLRAESDAVLREVADALSKNTAWKLDIEGHTDNIGGETMNMDLSSRRSAAVKKALVERYSIDAGRLTSSGFGASKPKETNDTIEGRAKNRRVELVRK